MTEAERVQLQSSLRRIEEGVGALGEWKAGAEVRLSHAEKSREALLKTIEGLNVKVDQLESQVDKSAWIVKIMGAVASASALGSLSQLM